MRKLQIAVIGASEPTAKQYKLAEDVGREVASEGWLLINGGLSGVMEASAKGASTGGGTVVGILPTVSVKDANAFVTIPIATNMGHGRNVIIVQSADACVAVGGGEGTLSEIAIALKEGKLVLGLESWDIPGVVKVKTAKEAVQFIKNDLPGS